MAVAPIPAGYHSVTPYLIVDGAAQGDRLLQARVRGGRAVSHDGPDGKIAHAEIKIGDSPVMLADVHGGAIAARRRFGGTPVSLMIYVADVDRIFTQAPSPAGRQR